MEREKYTHPSYGQIRFSRVSGKNRFYGSELEQQNYISLEIHGSEIERDLSKEWYYNRKLITRLRLSSNQFAELITSMNIGSGVPCTLEFYNETKTDALPDLDNRKEFLHRKFQDRMDEFSTTLKENQERAKELTKKKTLSKADQHELLLLIEKLTQEVSSNIPFFAKCFQENMDEIVQEAKTEIESAVQHKITTLGLEELHKQNNLLIAAKE